MAENDVLKMKVADLKRELKLRGLSTTGNKNELQERLQTALLDGDLTLEDTSITEDLLDEALTDDEDKGLDLSNEDAVLQSPDKDEDKSIAATITAQQQQQKKVVLKRKTSISLLPSTSTTSSVTTQSISEPPEKITKISSENSSSENKDSDGAKKVVKLSELSMKDRLEMRAKKFGVDTTTADGAKLARSARFGQASKADSISSANGAPSNTSMDTLKKRAERFGCSVSSRMVELERKQKLIKRQERFGAAGSTTEAPAAKQHAGSASVSTNSGTNYEEKAKQRLERFKTAVK